MAQTIERRSPAHGVVVTRVPRGRAEDARRAIAAARKAFDAGRWPHETASNRARVLLKVADLIDRDRENPGDPRYARIWQADRPGARRDRRRRGHLALRRLARARAFGRELRESRGGPAGLRPARADRRRVDHHALEFSTADRVAEASLRSGRRLRLRRQAKRDDLGVDAASRLAAGRGGIARRRLQHRHRLRP